MPNERGKIHEHKALVSPCEKLLSVHVRDAFRINTWSMSSGLCFQAHKSWHLLFPFELSRDITENFSVMGTPSLQPFLKTYWLTPVQMTGQLSRSMQIMTSSRQYKCGARDNYFRIFFFTLLNLGYGLNYYSSRLRFAHSRAGLMAAPLQRSGEYDIFLKVVRLPSDQRWTFGTQVMRSCRLNVRIPLTVEPAGQDISPASHAPLPWRCGEPKGKGSKGISRCRRSRTEKTHCVSMQPPPQSGVLLFAKHNHLAPHSFTGYQPLISGCRV